MKNLPEILSRNRDKTNLIIVFIKNICYFEKSDSLKLLMINYVCHSVPVLSLIQYCFGISRMKIT